MPGELIGQSRSEEVFAAAVSRAAGFDRLEALRVLFREVTPPCASWGVELAGEATQSLPDFGCAIETSVPVAQWPDRIVASPSYRILSSLVDAECIAGRWFFEFDATTGDGAFGEPHSFVRLNPDHRVPAVITPRLTAAAAALGEVIGTIAVRAARFAAGVPADCALSDIGVVIRRDVAQVRLGVAAPFARVPHLIGDMLEAGSARDRLVEIVDRCSRLAARCIAQVGVSGGERERPLRFTGLELSYPGRDQRGWGALLDVLVSCGALSQRLATAALDWPGRVPLPRHDRRWAPIFDRAISHVKVGVKASALPAAKVYLAASEAFGLFV